MTYVGSSRDKDVNGEQCGILFRKSRFALEQSGQFWLSETPQKSFSRSWDSSLPRIATWVQLRDRVTESPLIFINTHFDHRGRQARLESARLIRNFIEALPQEMMILVTGDFNCGEASEPYQQLTESTRMVDTFRMAHPDPAQNDGTFNGFVGKDSGARIDWILVSDDWTVSAADIDRYSKESRFPSDHFPVTAVIRRASGDLR